MLEQMKKRFIAWSDSTDDGIGMTIEENFKPSATSTILYEIEADTWEEAQAVHHVKMGWGPYLPGGNPAPCPNDCGSIYYPEGSGECPGCGKIC